MKRRGTAVFSASGWAILVAVMPRLCDFKLIKSWDVMFDFAEKALLGLAEKYVPEGTNAIALTHQWLHSLVNGFKPYAHSEGVNHQILIEELSKSGLFFDVDKLCSSMKSKFPMSRIGNQKFTFIDLFAGIGGMRIGFQSAGGTCVFSSEFEKNAQQTYFDNHGELPFGDITKIPEKHIPDHDILIAGFPCQPFSHAGLKLGIDDMRGTLFYDIARILQSKKPKFALLENVKGLISHDKGNTLQVILRVLTSIGYSCNISKETIENGSPKEIQLQAKKMVLRSYDFGVPQNRQRIYIVLWRDGIIEKFDYPESSGVKTKVGDILEEFPDEKYTISDKLWSGHQRRKVENAKNGKGFGFGLVTPESPYTNTISARYYKDGSEILIDSGNDKNPRKLTHREAARLQGFPDSFILNKSGTQAYKQFGNSVSVPVISAIASRIAEIV